MVMAKSQTNFNTLAYKLGNIVLLSSWHEQLDWITMMPMFSKQKLYVAIQQAKVYNNKRRCPIGLALSMWRTSWVCFHAIILLDAHFVWMKPRISKHNWYTTGDRLYTTPHTTKKMCKRSSTTIAENYLKRCSLCVRKYYSCENTAIHAHKN